MLQLEEKIFDEELQYISLEKYIDTSKSTLGCKVALLNNKFISHQQNIFNDILWDIIEFLQWDAPLFDDIRALLDHKLQEINMKLLAFSEEMQSEERFGISGVIQIIVDNQYLSALIGSSSLMIFRDNVLIYTVGNDATELRVDQFSEIIEWDLEEDDTVLVWGNNLSTYLDDDDLAKISHFSDDLETTYIDQLINILWVRLPEQKLKFYQQLSYVTEQKITKKKLKKSLSKSFRSLNWLKELAWNYRKELQYWSMWLLTMLLLIWSLSWFSQDANSTITDENWEVIIDFWIDDIQKDIAIFKQINPESDEKVKQYNKIFNRLTLLEENWKWSFDVKELKGILEQDYKQWFNIKILNDEKLLWDPVYSFTQLEKNTFWNPTHLYYNNWFYVWGEDGVLIGAISETVRWSLISSAIGQKLDQCYFNLLKNWLFCAASDGTIYNSDKNWFVPVTTDDQKFPRAIAALGTFRSNRLYTLSNDDRLNNEWVYVSMYQNKTWSQNEFEESVNYTLTDWFKTDHPTAFGSGGVGSFAIDGTFIVRSQWDQSLYQLWREWVATDFVWRKLDLSWGDTVSVPFSDQTQIYAQADSRYLQLFDPINQTFTVYRSSPFKTTPGGEKSRKPMYFFQLRFEFDETLQIIDLYVEEWEKSNLYIMTTDNIYKLPLHEYLDEYNAQAESE